ncbi:MAG: hypothetical protein PHR12_01230 [Victivallaceae bacterium]|nr:hypothetical protein [Victivallaceae bacterium]
MDKYLVGKNIRLRCKKSYPDAHTHIIIGQVLEETAKYIAVKGRTFHFNRIIDQMRSQIHSGDNMIRIIPWENVEVIHWISERTDWNVDIAFDSNGNLVLNDKAKTVIAQKRDGME